LRRDLPAGHLRCTACLKSDVGVARRQQTRGHQAFGIQHRGPAIVQMYAAIEGQCHLSKSEIFLLRNLNAPATAQSIVETRFLRYRRNDGARPGERHRRRRRKTLLAARRDFVDRFLYVLFKTAARFLIGGRPFGKGTRFEQFLAADGGARFPIALLQMQARLPNKAQVRLVWGKGIVSESGVPSSQDQVLVTRCATLSRRALPATG